jgi:hypothetical protein
VLPGSSSQCGLVMARRNLMGRGSGCGIGVLLGECLALLLEIWLAFSEVTRCASSWVAIM